MYSKLRSPMSMGCCVVTGSVGGVLRASGSLSAVVSHRHFSLATAAPKKSFTQGKTNATFFHEQIPAPKTPCQLRNRLYVPCSGDPKFPDNVPNATETFPYLLRCGEDVQKMTIEEFAGYAKQIYEEYLPTYGAIMFKDTPIKDVKEYNRFMVALEYRTMDFLHYLKFMGARSMQSTQIDAAVRTASDEPGDYAIEPHCEFHTAGLPHKISLWCQSPSAAAGESLLSNNRQILKELKQQHPEIYSELKEKGIEYEVYYPSREFSKYNSWEKNINCDKEKVAEYLETMGYEFEWEKHEDALRYKKTIPAVEEHPITGEECFYNQLQAHHWTFYEGHPVFRDIKDKANFEYWPVNTRFGDGKNFTPEMVSKVRNIVWRNTAAFDLNFGDVVMADNYLVQHGRMPYEKDDKSRKVFVSVTYD